MIKTITTHGNAIEGSAENSMATACLADRHISLGCYPSLPHDAHIVQEMAGVFQQRYSLNPSLNDKRFCEAPRAIVAQETPNSDVLDIEAHKTTSDLLNTPAGAAYSGRRRELIRKLGTINTKEAANGLVKFLATPLTSEHEFALDTLMGMSVAEKIKIDGCGNLLRHGDIHTSRGAMKYLITLRDPSADKLLEEIASSDLPSPEPIVAEDFAPAKERIIYPPKIIEMAKKGLKWRQEEVKLWKEMEEDPINPDTQYRMGQRFFKKEQYHLAKMFFEHAVQFKPDHHEARYYLADCIYGFAKYKEYKGYKETREDRLEDYKEALKHLEYLEKTPMEGQAEKLKVEKDNRGGNNYGGTERIEGQRTTNRK